MAALRQIAVTLLLIAVAGCAWLYLSPAPGRFLLADGRLPEALHPLVSALSPADNGPKVGATPAGRGGGRQTPLVAVSTARPLVTRDRLRAIGSGEAVRTVAVRPDASGIVKSLSFRSGDAVEAGATLAQLQDDAERIAVDRARIALATATDQLSRYETLAATGSSITSVQLEEVRRARDAAALDLRAAEVALAKRSITAPIAGHVGLLDLEIGALVDSSTLIATVDDRSKLRILFDAPEAFATQLAVGLPITAVPATRSGETYQGVVTALDSRLDQASRTLRAEATIDNEGDRLRPGLSFSVEIGFEGESFVAVDPLAVQWERTGPFVWVVADDRTSKAPIAIIERNIDSVLVASDTLKAGDTVVTEGVQLLREGGSVRVRETTGVDAVPDDEGPPTAESPPAGRRADAGTLLAPPAEAAAR
ncbi:efflux RND transporter periplasmic adaptor subunit [Aureimonas flava]|uniref:Efflux RND transporter periplasmic adaptor subunit n=1 Tax=Aureimonas flava TaxID=2320271 RepID=A0A3A1WNP6_9HYPH|nr:efflux RND transporter periplasmic adaptor subunit [Aureimonas flava]RIY02145.1 efflux RND transporter periplasmic adaptor subunit [Aureimonas flava]